MSPGKVRKKEGERVLLSVDENKVHTRRPYGGGMLSLEEFPPGVRATYHYTVEDEQGATTTEIRRRVKPGVEVELEIQTRKGVEVIIIQSD